MNRIDTFRKSGLVFVTLITAFLLSGCTNGPGAGGRRGGQQVGGGRVGAAAGRLGGNRGGAPRAGNLFGGGREGNLMAQLFPDLMGNPAVARAQGTIGELRRTQGDLMTRIEGNNRRIGELEQQVRDGRISLTQAQDEVTRLQGENARLTVERDQAQARVTDLEQQIAGTRTGAGSEVAASGELARNGMIQDDRFGPAPTGARSEVAASAELARAGQIQDDRFSPAPDPTPAVEAPAATDSTWIGAP